jgi:hypothetical protein
MKLLRETLTFNQAKATLESEGEGSNKSLYLKGICVQAEQRNANQRVYPLHEIGRAVDSINRQIKEGRSVLGEVDHPSDLKINLDRVSHMITEMWMDGNNGCGKMKILPTPMGNIVKTMLESGVLLGVSSRGQGDVNESNGKVSNFEILTVDVVAQPSAPDAYPQAIYEGIMNMKNGHNLINLAAEVSYDSKVQKYLTKEIVKVIRDLKL